MIVAGSGPRAVVTTASYEARAFGVGSAMPASRARRLCPDAVVIPPDFTAYRETSKRVWELVGERLDRVQQIGIDEAYADLTGVEKPLRVLREVVAAVKEATGIVISIGVGPSRLVAKCCSDLGKPAGFVAMGREEACVRFATAPTSRVPGIGPKTADRLAELGVRTIAQLQQADEERLAGRFGANTARFLKARALFEDDSPVETERVAAKSVSSERTFDEDISDLERLEAVLREMSRELCEGLQRRGRRGRTIAIKVRLDDWTTVTRARTVEAATNDAAQVIEVAVELLRAYAPPRPVRLLGVRLAGFEDVEPEPRRAPAAATGQLALAALDSCAVGYTVGVRWTMLTSRARGGGRGMWGRGERVAHPRRVGEARGRGVQAGGRARSSSAAGPRTCGRSRRSRRTPPSDVRKAIAEIRRLPGAGERRSRAAVPRRRSATSTRVLDDLIRASTADGHGRPAGDRHARSASSCPRSRSSARGAGLRWCVQHGEGRMVQDGIRAPLPPTSWRGSIEAFPRLTHSSPRSLRRLADGLRDVHGGARAPRSPRAGPVRDGRVQGRGRRVRVSRVYVSQDRAAAGLSQARTTFRPGERRRGAHAQPPDAGARRGAGRRRRGRARRTA